METQREVTPFVERLCRIHAVSRLSVRQQRILLWLLARVVVEAAGQEKQHIVVRWERTAKTRSESACVSRSLKRLEDRGLVERLNETTDDLETVERKRRGTHRTTHVCLSQRGRMVAARLLAESCSQP